jgi:hypothetical protein
MAARVKLGSAALPNPRVLVALLAGTALLLAGLWRLPSSIRSLDATAAAYANQTSLDRSLHAAAGEDIDPRILLAARRAIPPHATYAVVTGPAAPDLGTNTLAAFAPFAAYWLLPRVQVPAGGSPAPAWVVSYGGDLGALGYRYRRTLRVGPGLALAEVAR